MSADPSRVKAIFLQAVEECEPGQWGAFLDAACPGDVELRRRVEILLAAHLGRDSVLDARDEGPSDKQNEGGLPTFDSPCLERLDTRIGPYKLLEEIGRGGMGVVYMAEQTEPVRRRVALKIVKPGMDTQQVLARFEAERQALSLMDHPNIARVLDAGTTGGKGVRSHLCEAPEGPFRQLTPDPFSATEGNPKSEARNTKQIPSTKSKYQTPESQPVSDIRTSDLELVSDFGFRASDFIQGRPYFVMELIRGQPITEYCDDYRLSPRERLELFLPVCQAIQHAHQKGIVHRDIKPSNVLIAEYDGRPVPKVIDFGVAKAIGHSLTEETLFTGFGQIVGTLEYMSPEQAKPNQLDIDTRSDIYSLGVLLYELLTGVPPFDKQRLRSAAWDEILRIIREEDPPRPSHRLSSIETLPSVAANRKMEPAKLTGLVRGELDWIVMKALDKDRSRRYDTANGLAMDIQRYLTDQAISACPPSAAYRFRKFARRNKGLLAAAVAILGVMLLGSGLATWQAIRATRAERSVSLLLVTEQQAHDKTLAAVQEAKLQLFNAYHAQARAIRSSGRPGQRLDALDAVANAVPLMESLGLGDEERVALRDEAIGSLELVDLRPMQRWKARQNMTQGATSLSNDFQFLTFSQEDVIRVRRTDHPTADLKGIPTDKGQYEQFLRFDPTNRYLCRTRPADPIASIVDCDAGKDILQISNLLCFAAVDFHPRRAQVAVGDRHGVVRIWDLVSGQELRQWSIGRPIWSVKYDPQGDRLAIGSGGTAADGAATSEIEVRSTLTDEVVFKHPQLGVQTVLDWHPDGQWLAVGASSDIHLFEVDSIAGRHLVFHGHRSTIIGLQFHPGGQLLASASWDGTTRLWDSVSGQQLLRLEGHLIGFSKDGSRLACRQGLEVAIFEIVAPRAHRWLSRGMTAAVAVAADDRLMVAGHDDGIRLWDLDRLVQLAHLPIGPTLGVAFSAPTGNLVTSGKAGLYAWPIRMSSQGGVRQVRLGPPVAFDESLKNMRSVHLSRDGGVLFAEAYFRDEAFVFRPSEPGRPSLRLDRTGLSLSALSPDGKWAVASSSEGPDVRIWNALTGEHVRDLPTSGGAQICFSPDGRSLITNGGPQMCIWDVPTWQLRHETSFTSDSASGVAVTPDSRLAAIGVWGIGVMLIEVDTGRRVAMLDMPEKTPVFVDLIFTADGSRLIAAADHAGCCVWDLRVLRACLAQLNLDWNRPPFPNTDSVSPKPALQLEVDLGALAEKIPP